MTRGLTLCCYLIIALAGFANAQTTTPAAKTTTASGTPAINGIDIVNVKLDQASFVQAAFPFNIRFALVGDIPTDCVSIEMLYMIDPNDKRKNKKWISLPKVNNGTFQHCDSWTKQDGSTQFVLVCPGIHPNFSYDYQFNVCKQINLSADDKQTLKNNLSAAIASFYNNAVQHGGYTAADVQNLNTSLNGIITATTIKSPGPTLINKVGNTAYIADVTSNLKLPFDKVTGAVNDVNNANNTYNGARIAFMNAFTHQIVPIRSSVAATVNPVTQFEPQSKVYLGLTFTPDLPDFASYSLMDGVQILQKAVNQPNKLDQLLQGKAKISGTDIVPSSKADYPSIQFMIKLINYLKTGLLKDEDNQHRVNTAFDILNDVALQAAITDLQTYAGQVDAANKELQDAAKNFPDVTAGLLIENTVTLNAVSIPDVSTSKTPYISVDGGVGYAAGFRSAVSYYGASFYLAPVNLKTSACDFKGTYLLRQMFYLNIGISNFFGTRPVNSYSLLGQTSNSDLLFGLGIRAGKFLRFTFDAMPYKTNNIDQLSTTDLHLKCDFVATIGIDINLLGALGNVAKTLNISN